MKRVVSRDVNPVSGAEISVTTITSTRNKGIMVGASNREMMNGDGVAEGLGNVEIVGVRVGELEGTLEGGGKAV